MIMDTADLEHYKQREAERRFKLLGCCAGDECDNRRLRDRSGETFVPIWFLADWQHKYRLQGIDGLLPVDWSPLNDLTLQLVQARYEQLAAIADLECITSEDLHLLAAQKGWSDSKTERWVRRYRSGGLWALAPDLDPNRKHRREKIPPPMMAAIEPDEFNDVFDEITRRYEIIKPLLSKDRLTNKDIEACANKANVSPSTVRNYLRDYRSYGLAGLTRRTRSDKGHYHNLSERMINIIHGIRFSKYRPPLHDVHRRAGEIARLIGEPEPSEWQVRQVLKDIPRGVILLADGRRGDFRDDIRITHPLPFDGSVIVYQLDWHRVDVLAKDIRKKKFRKKSKETRPYLTLCLDANFGLVIAAAFSYDVPDQFTIASVIRDALLAPLYKPYGGIPDEIWVDQGDQMISRHVQAIALEQHITLHPCIPNNPQDRGNPQENGRVERFFRTLKDGLWATLEGYIGSNTEERNPNAKAEHTIAELAKKFWEFVDTYHHTVDEETGMTPLQNWLEHCHTQVANPRKLDVLLVREKRKLSKEGIQYANRLYWDDCFGDAIPTDVWVTIHAKPDYMRPDNIEVYYEKLHICTARATDSDVGRAVTGAQVAEAQRRQEKEIKEFIHEGRSALKEAVREIEKSGQKQLSAPPEKQVTQPVEAKSNQVTGSSQAASKPKKKVQDVWDRILTLGE
jgi:putative transposase